LADLTLHPRTQEELAEALAQASARKQSVSIGGRFSKNSLGGPMEPADCILSTRCMARVLQYEPRDLTISVESGMAWAEFAALLASNRQMVPLDPPFSDSSTVGGVIAANLSGPRRRLYGTARDVVIGIKFATAAGELVQSGGMVVKNVAGLDMAKLLIGSLGTLAAIAVVNFKLAPLPVAERSFLLPFDTLDAAVKVRNAVLRSYLQPEALDLLSPAAAAALGRRAWTLAIQAGGNQAAISRYEKEIAELGDGIVLEGSDEQELWEHVREFAPRFLKTNPTGAVARASCKLSELGEVLRTTSGPAVSRAGSGVVYAAFPDAAAAAAWAGDAAKRGWKAVVDYAPPNVKRGIELWPAPGQDLQVMLRIKQMLDPERLLNRGRYYRHF
jgi:glycolate oxidase FAD binding subunit